MSSNSEFRFEPAWVSGSLLVLWIATAIGIIAAVQGLIPFSVAVGILVVTAVADLIADFGTQLLVGLLLAIIFSLVLKLYNLVNRKAAAWGGSND